MTSLWINLGKHKAMLSNLTFKEVKVFEAHSEKRPGLTEYVDKRLYDALVKKYMDLQEQLEQKQELTQQV